MILERSKRVSSTDTPFMKTNVTNNTFSLIQRCNDLNKTFPVIEKRHFDDILSAFQDNYNIDDPYLMSKEDRAELQALSVRWYIVKHTRDSYVWSEKIVLDKNKYTLSDGDDIISSKLVQIGNNMTEMLIKEIPAAEYTRVPPNYVIEKAEATKDLFDEMVVIYPEHRLAKSPIIEDPLLCGKIKWYAGYFLIAIWDEDVDIVDYLVKYNQTPNKALMNVIE